MADSGLRAQYNGTMQNAIHNMMCHVEEVEHSFFLGAFGSSHDVMNWGEHLDDIITDCESV